MRLFSRSLRPFLVWLGLFYSVWLGLVWVGDFWPVVKANWGIALAMLFGSYIAGSTPMGGGTVGFPILVLLFDQPATLGRDFSFAVQSVGMTSASIFILCRRQPLEWPLLRAAMLGSLVGTPLGIIFLAPLVPGLLIKVMFAVVWASFGMLHLAKLREIAGHTGITPTDHAFDTRAGLLIGLLAGGAVASITGIGADMMLYVVLVLLCHADLKIAIPSSVLLMAFTSVIGLVTKLVMGDVQPGVWDNWLAAAPVVALGAPLGVLIVDRIGRRSTLVVVSLLCLGQFGWTCWNERVALGAWGILAALIAVGLFNLVFMELHAWGNRMARRCARPPVTEPGGS